MKIKIFALIMAILCLSTVFVSCNDAETPCTSHVDENKDGKCDVCSAEVKAECTEHVDADNDGKCDVCGAEVKAECADHVDTDNNGKCDVCGADVSVKITCETHTDVDADGFCDGCGGAIVVIYEKVEPDTEKRVPMIVSAIPDASVTDYVITTIEEIAAVKTLEKSDKKFELLEKKVNKNLVKATISTQDTDSGLVLYTTYMIYDVITKDVIYTNDTNYTGDVAGATKTVYIDNTSKYFFTVTVTVTEPQSEGDDIVTKNYECYTYGGEKLYSLQWKSNNEDGKLWSDVEVVPSVNTKNGVAYVTIENDVFAFDSDNDEYLGFKFDKASLVCRPEFNKVVDNYGYIEYQGKLFIYDLTQWIDCIYSFEIYDSVGIITCEWFVLSNGNVLIQRISKLPNMAVSYDVSENGYKLDLTYTLIDVAEKTAANVEFGYYILAVQPLDDFDELTAENLFIVNKIENSVIVPAETCLFVSNEVSEDGKLQIVCDSTEFVLDWYIVDDDLFLVTERYDSSTEAQKIVDKTGKLVTYIPEGATVEDTYIFYDGNYYNFKMELIIDCDKYEVERINDVYAILKETEQVNDAEGAVTIVTNYYYYKFGASEYVKLDAGYDGITDYIWGCVVHFEVTDETTGTVTHINKMFNDNAELLLELGDSTVENFYVIDGGYVVEIKTVTLVEGVSTTSYQQYILK